MSTYKKCMFCGGPIDYRKHLPGQNRRCCHRCYRNPKNHRRPSPTYGEFYGAAMYEDL